MTAIDVSRDEYDRLEPAERGAAEAFLEQHPAGAGAPLAVVIPAYNEEPTVAGGDGSRGSRAGACGPPARPSPRQSDRPTREKC